MIPYSHPHFGCAECMAVPLPRCKQIAAAILLISWIAAVISCSIKPLPVCAPAGLPPSSGSENHYGHVDSTDAAHHSDEGHSHSEEDADEETGSSSCADDEGCQAIASAILGSENVSAFPAVYILVFFQNWLEQRISASVLNAVRAIPEAVLVLTHEVCTHAAAFSTAPPFAA